MKEYPPNPHDQPQPPPEPRRRSRFRPWRFFRRLLLILLCLAVAFLLVRYGPNLYRRFFGDGNTTWVSQRFSEELKEKNELVIYEATLTGQDTVSQEAWLLGTVQKVTVPYSYSISFVVDLNLAAVSVDTASDTIVVRLPPPEAKYPKLTVDEDQMQKYDWLYPLTPERYAQIKSEIEQKLTDECSAKQEYLDAAWSAAVRNMETLFGSVTAQSDDGVTCTIQVIQDDSLAAAQDETAATLAPAATPEAA